MTRFVAALALWLAAALPAFALAPVQEVTSPGGITAWLVEEPSIPFVALEIRFRGGTSVDPEGARGAVNLMTALLEEGAGEMDAQAFAAARDDLAASFRFRAYDDALSVSARFLSDTSDAAAGLLYTVLTEPRFDPEAVERVRAQVLSGLRQDVQNPDTIASNAFAAAAFGDHPYGSSGDGTLESVAALTRDDLAEAHAGAIARDRVYVGAVGDIDADELAALVDEIFADLPEEGADLPGPAALLLEGGTTVIDFGTPQSIIQFAQPGIERDDDDFFTAYVMNHILGGGGFGARLMDEVREKRGLTYGIYSYLAQKDHADLLLGRSAIGNANVAEAIEVIRAEWVRMAEDGATAEELEQAKTFLTGAYPLRFDGNDTIASILVGMQMDGLARDYIETRNARVEAVTREDVARVARELLQPGGLSFLVVGQPEGVATTN